MKRIVTSLVVLSLLVLNCKGENPPEGLSEEKSSLFVSDGADAESDAVVVEMVRAEENILTVALTARSISEPIYGVAAELVYNPALFKYLDYKPEELLEGSPEAAEDQLCRAALLDGQPGRLVLGASRLGALPGVTGSGRVVTLRFEGLKTGSCRFDLESLVCRRSDLSRIDGIRAKGGWADCRLDLLRK